MMFASKTPRDLNHDPLPFRLANGKLPNDRFGVAWNKFYAHDPRREFDHVQHNQPNPILVDFREYARNAGNSPRLAAHWTRSDEVWLDVTTALLGDAPMGTPEQEKHARRVLTRLARLAEVAS